MRLVIFDIDGTLVDSQAYILRAMEAGLTAAGLANLPRDRVLSVVGLSLPTAVATLLPGADAATRDIVVDAYRNAYRASHATTQSPLFLGARECLERLAARDDLLLGVATGKSQRGLDGILAAHGLTDMFVTVHCADGHPSKPAPGMVLACLRDAGVDAAHALMIGDTTFDVQMAVNAGVAAFGVTWGHHTPDALTAAGARRIAHDFPDLIALIEEWAT